MRVIAGKYRHLNLNTLDGLNTRPTKDMVKEALFSSLNIFEGCSFLDLFAGSGAIGIEAISRGANDVVFNDINKDAIKIIKQNLNIIKEERQIFNLDYVACLNILKNRQFDYIFLDPPYSLVVYEEIFKLIIEFNILKNGGIIVCEMDKNINLSDNYLQLNKYKEKKYGICKLNYFRRDENA